MEIMISRRLQRDFKYFRFKTDGVDLVGFNHYYESKENNKYIISFCRTNVFYCVSPVFLFKKREHSNQHDFDFVWLKTNAVFYIDKMKETELMDILNTSLDELIVRGRLEKL